MSEARFNELFDRWAATYDETVTDPTGEYAEVFAGYDRILARVAGEVGLPAGSVVVEIGVGTGNLTRELLMRGYQVIGVEPSREMRQQAKRKLPPLDLRDGDFLHLPLSDERVEAFVSTYAFHHLTDEEKERALTQMAARLAPGGKVVFADTVFASEDERRAFIDEARRKGYIQLLQDLETEFYPTLPVLETLYRRAGFAVSFERLNRYVWLSTAVRR
ncbi:MAG: methyltransferase domain-containing protein [Calditerricola sp.]|jgi:Methylase involved in ubiquinone/menaquinone biosynthesis|nr:SAM-dependent methyltransferase [Bacillota bacterium]MCG0313818.1 methyltransferase domain-containing protein [Calditerricola sp.]